MQSMIYYALERKGGIAMQYRSLGQTGIEASILGFGCMRFPTVENPDPNSDVGNINQDEAIKMLRYGIDNGINYIDTAYPYHGGNSEIVVGNALQDGYRDKVSLVTKLPIWKIETHEDFDTTLDEQLAKLQTDYVDIYLVHALNAGTWKKAQELKVFDFLERAVADGRIKHIGFSFHDKLEVFKEIVDAYDWEVCQIQLNYLDEQYQAGLEGLHYAVAKDIGIIIMEPLRGGKLTNDLPGPVHEIWAQAQEQKSPPEWAFRWVYNHPQVAVVLSGMSTMDQVIENLAIADHGMANSLTKDELVIINNVKEFFTSRIKVNCTDCRYCLPCPQGVGIPNVFSTLNNASMWDAYPQGRRGYSRLVSKEQDASRCVECGLCEDACPQNLEIIRLLKEAHQELGEPAANQANR